MSKIKPDVIYWNNSKPIHTGLYVYKIEGRIPIHIDTIAKGDWKQAQNPEWLYCGANCINEMDAIWLGPLPEPKD